MPYIFRPMTAPDAAAIAQWHYPEPYSFYDMDQDPDDLTELLDPQSWQDRYYAVTDEAGILVGFFVFSRHETDLEIGLGLRPDLTGRGMGLDFVLVGLSYARAHYHPVRFRLVVAAFNERAIRLYQKAGFRQTHTFRQQTNGSEFDFVAMERASQL